MADKLQIDQLLDSWEELKEVDPQLSLQQFISDRLRGEKREFIEAFRRKAEDLAAIDRQMQRVVALPPTADSPQRHSELSLRSLQPGLEPVSGYTLVSRLGGGGFGEVWKARSSGGFHVALKFVQTGGRVGDIEERSLDVIKDVRHPNLLSVFGTWRIGELLVIATELADRTLLDRLHEAQKAGHGGIPKEELLEYVAEAAKGIDALNDPGSSGRMRIQHRDIKPQNLLLSGGSVKVGDFGLARSIQYDVTRHTGSMTFAYAAPECFAGSTSHHSDQYSLAIAYCQLRGGRLPFEGTPVEIMEGHRKRQPDLSMIPAEERPAVTQALAKLPKDRWNSCTEFVQALYCTAACKSRRPATRSILKLRSAVAIGLTALVALGCVVLTGRLLPGWRGVKELSESANNIQTETRLPSRTNNEVALLLRSAMGEFPLTVVRYAVRADSSSPFPDEGTAYAVMATIDHDAYQDLRRKLDAELTPLAKASGEGLLGVAAKEERFYSGVLQYGKTSPREMANAIHSALGYSLRGSPKPEGCVVLVASEIRETPWGDQDSDSLQKFEGGNRVLATKWYWVSSKAAEPLYLAFRRGRDIEVTVAAGGSLLKVIRSNTDPLKDADLTHFPGGSVGSVFSAGTGGGALTIRKARDDFNHAIRFGASPNVNEIPLIDDAERVLLVMPGFYANGEYSEQVKIADLPPALLHGVDVDKLRVQAKLLSP